MGLDEEEIEQHLARIEERKKNLKHNSDFVKQNSELVEALSEQAKIRKEKIEKLLSRCKEIDEYIDNDSSFTFGMDESLQMDNASAAIQRDSNWIRGEIRFKEPFTDSQGNKYTHTDFFCVDGQGNMAYTKKHNGVSVEKAALIFPSAGCAENTKTQDPGLVLKKLEEFQ